MAEIFVENREEGSSPLSLHNIPVLTQSHPISVKLTESNYLVWKQQLMSTIRAFDLESFLFGEQEVPRRLVAVEGSPQLRINPDYLSWKKHDQLLDAWLQSKSLTPSSVSPPLVLSTPPISSFLPHIPPIVPTVSASPSSQHSHDSSSSDLVSQSCLPFPTAFSYFLFFCSCLSSHSLFSIFFLYSYYRPSTST